MDCERCDRSDSAAGEITHYKEHDCSMNLCKDCIAIIEKPYNEKCAQCEKLVWKNGGAKKHENQIFCLHCHQNILSSKNMKLAPKTSILKKRNFWFSVGLVIVGILILTEYIR
jgi:hypothetical protein